MKVKVTEQELTVIKFKNLLEKRDLIEPDKPV